MSDIREILSWSILSDLPKEKHTPVEYYPLHIINAVESLKKLAGCEKGNTYSVIPKTSER